MFYYVVVLVFGVVETVGDIGFFFFKQKTAYEMRISDWSSECALPICRNAASCRDCIRPVGYNPYAGYPPVAAHVSASFRKSTGPEQYEDRLRRSRCRGQARECTIPIRGARGPQDQGRADHRQSMCPCAAAHRRPAEPPLPAEQFPDGASRRRKNAVAQLKDQEFFRA